jgi:hypothetical protein
MELILNHCIQNPSNILTCKDTRTLSVFHLSRIIDTESLYTKPILTCKITRSLSVFLLSRITDTESLYTKSMEYFNIVKLHVLCLYCISTNTELT